MLSTRVENTGTRTDAGDEKHTTVPQGLLLDSTELEFIATLLYPHSHGHALPSPAVEGFVFTQVVSSGGAQLTYSSLHNQLQSF